MSLCIKDLLAPLVVHPRVKREIRASVSRPMFVHRSPQQGSHEPRRFAPLCPAGVIPYSVLAASQTSVIGLFEYALEQSSRLFDWLLRCGHVLLDVRLTERYQVEHGDAQPAREFIIKLEIVLIQQNRHFDLSRNERGQSGWIDSLDRQLLTIL
jgi:hypothetical protein